MVLEAPERLEARTFDRPDVSETGALLEVEMTSVCGTDVSLYRGKGSMGEYPVVLGHEVAGRIVEGAPETLERWGVSIGDRVMPEPYIPCWDCADCQGGDYHMCDELRTYGVTVSADVPPHLWGGYGEYMYLDPNSRIHRVPDGVSSRAACLGSVIGNGVRWIVRKGRVAPGDGVAIVGPGAQGLATTVVAEAAGADPLVVLGLPEDEPKLSLARSLGATATLDSTAGDVRERAIADLDRPGFDVVVVTAPAAAAVRLGIELVRPRGSVVLVGLGDTPSTLDLDRVVLDEITLLGGRGQAGDVERAMAILERNAENVARINSHVFPLPEAETAIRRQIPGEERDIDIVHAALEPA